MLDVVQLERRRRESDILTSNHGVFRYLDREKIMAIAFEREAAGEAWEDVVRDFHSAKPQYWGFQVVPYGHRDSKRPKTEEEIRNRDVLVFVWTAIQSLVIIKAVIMYFGLNYSIERDDSFGSSVASGGGFYGWGLAISLVISFGGLITFAIRKSRGREWH